MASVFQEELNTLQAAYESAAGSRAFAPLAEIYHRAGHFEAAIDLLQTGTLQHPDYVSANVLLGECYKQLGREEEAAAVFSQVSTMDPENLVALRYQAERALGQKALARAQTIIDKLNQLDPFDSATRELHRSLQERLEEPSASGPPVSGAPERTHASPSPGELIGVEPPPFDLTEPVSPETPEPFGAPSAASADKTDPTTIIVDEVLLPLPAGTPSQQNPDEFSTLTLAQIYESQGYLEKALSIYDELVRKHPNHPEIQKRLLALQARLAGQSTPPDLATVRLPAQTTIDPSTDRQIHPDPEWKPLNISEFQPDAQMAANELRQLSADVRSKQTNPEFSLLKTGASPGPPVQDVESSPYEPPVSSEPNGAVSAEGTQSTQADYERFLRYVRSLKR